MVRISHSVTVAAVPRSWTHQALSLFYGLARETHTEKEEVLLPGNGNRAVPGLRLVQGRHLSPGAVYEVDDAEQAQVRVTVREFDRRSALRVECVVRDEETGSLTVLECSLTSVDRPHRAEMRGSLLLGGKWRSLAKATGGAELGLENWWASAAGRRSHAPALRGHLDHRLAKATVRAVPRPCDDGRWDMRVTLSVRGRSLLRPLVSAGLLLTRRPLGRALADLLDGLARQWNEHVPHATAHQDMGQLRERFLARATDTA
ncbi:hypothetical protein ACFWY6_05295 [Streptomyces sp. NPDC059037]|uniref:hypothetical protein n=1 Tax=Streptomyces sp. NPDC059037 TaxID=3346710 RepID=UPI0036B8CA0B